MFEVQYTPSGSLTHRVHQITKLDNQDVPVEAKRSHAITCTRDQHGSGSNGSSRGGNGGGGGVLMSALRRLSTSLNTSSSGGGKAGGPRTVVAATGAGDVCPCMAAASEEAGRRFQGFSFVCEELPPLGAASDL